jgi:small subunit ribosomal protein S16
MAVRIRLKRFGRKNRDFFRVCVFDHRTRRDGRPIEEVGHYDPLVKEDEKKYSLNRERIAFWLAKGALPTETVESIFLSQGIDVPTSGKKRAMTPQERQAHAKDREEKKRKREVSIQRKAAVAATKDVKLTKKEQREAKKAGGSGGARRRRRGGEEPGSWSCGSTC